MRVRSGMGVGVRLLRAGGYGGEGWCNIFGKCGEREGRASAYEDDAG